MENRPVVLRPGRPDDAPAIYALIVGCLANSLPLTVYSDPRSLNFLIHILHEPEPMIVVAECGGRVVGFHQNVVARGAFNINHGAVSPDMRGRGVGSALFRACEEWARERGFSRVTNDVLVRDVRIIERYRRFGYRVVDRHFNMQLTIPERWPQAPTFHIDPSSLGVALASIGRVGFGRIEARRGEDVMLVGVIGERTCRLLDPGPLAVEEAVIEIRALFAGIRSLLVVINLPAPLDIEGILVVDEAAHLERVISED